MDTASLSIKLNRIMLATLGLTLAAVVLLTIRSSPAQPTTEPPPWLLAVMAVTGLTACLILVHRAILPVIRMAERLTDINERLVAGKPSEPLTLELAPPFDRLLESHQRMHRSAAMRQHTLRTEFDRLGAVLQTMHEGVVAIDRDEKVLLANAASRNMLHFVSGDVTGKPFLEASRNWSLCESLRQCLATGRLQQREIQTSHEPIRTLALHASCLPGDPPSGAVAVLHDVTELRRLENLRHEFVANVSHELKTPLAAIMAYAETLKLGAINDQENNLSFVHRIEEQAERLHQLILDILQIARVESGQEVFEIVPLPLHTFAQDTIAGHADAAKHKQLSLALDASQEVFVRADADGLRTILDNLVSNAVKYTPDGGSITVSVKVDEVHAIIEVIDTGIGISEANLPRVFERFFRADRARARSVISTGLGLSIVKHLVQSFGGSVSVTSQLGQGSRFEVRLPLTPDVPHV